MANLEGKKHVRSIEYRDIKNLLEAGMSVSAVCRLTGRSWPTVVRVNRSETYHAYQSSAPKKQKADKGVDLIKSLAEVEKLLNNILDEYSKISLRVDLLENRARYHQVPVNAQI